MLLLSAILAFYIRIYLWSHSSIWIKRIIEQNCENTISSYVSISTTSFGIFPLQLISKFIWIKQLDQIYCGLFCFSLMVSLMDLNRNHQTLKQNTESTIPLICEIPNKKSPCMFVIRGQNSVTKSFSAAMDSEHTRTTRQFLLTSEKARRVFLNFPGNCEDQLHLLSESSKYLCIGFLFFLWIFRKSMRESWTRSYHLRAWKKLGIPNAILFFFL